MKNSHLPTQTTNGNKALTGWQNSPAEYYQALKASNVVIARKENFATIAEIRQQLGEMGARAIVVIALVDIVQNLNISRNMTDKQIAHTADMIIQQYWYYSIQEIKDCLYRAISNEKLFERLDSNVIMLWFRDYDIKRDEMIIELQQNERSRKDAEIAQAATDSSSFDDYRERIAQRAAQGDKQAIADLANIQAVMAHSETPEQRRLKEIAFQQFKANYLNTQKNVKQ